MLGRSICGLVFLLGVLRSAVPRKFEALAAMIPVYVLNLARSTARLAHMQSELARLDVPFQRIAAVAAEDVAKHEDYAHIPPQELRPWTRGELACLLTHREAWKCIAAGSAPFGAVLEDDLHIHGSFRDALLGSQLPPDADIVKLETTNVVVQTSRRRFVISSSSFHLRRMRGVSHGSGAYVISRSCAARAVNALSTFSLPVDDCLFGEGHSLGATLVKYQQVPASIVQDCILPPSQRSSELSSMLDAERHVAISGRLLALRTGVLPAILDTTFRIPRAILRRFPWRYSRIPYAGGSLDG